MTDGNKKGELPAVLDLPSGKVWFRDLDDQPLTGKDLRTWRKLLNTSGRGDYVQQSIDLLMSIFITRWEFPALPRLPLPSEDPTVTDLLPVDDIHVIEDALNPMIDELNGVANRSRRTDTGPGSPTPPSSE